MAVVKSEGGITLPQEGEDETGLHEREEPTRAAESTRPVEERLT
jgi:hypothetical protein